MNIIHVIEATATGTLTMAGLLSSAQVKQGHQTYVIYSRRPETPSNIEDIFDKKINLVNIQMNSLSEKIFSIIKLRTFFSQHEPDVIFLHSSFAGFLGRLASAGVCPEAKIYYIPHCISFMRKDISSIKKYIFVLFEKLAALKKSEYIACSLSEQKEIQAKISFRKCHLVENAIIIPTQDTTRKEPVFSVITVGQIRPQKGPKDFAYIAEAVKKKFPNISFIWVGDGDPTLRNELERAGVKVSGWATKEEIWKRLRESELYLSTSRWEGMPVSIIEAIFAGLPVIASRCPGNLDVITHDSTGWLYNSTDEAVGLLLKALANKNFVFNMAEKARFMALDRFSPARYIEEIDTIINNSVTLTRETVNSET